METNNPEAHSHHPHEGLYMHLVSKCCFSSSLMLINSLFPAGFRSGDREMLHFPSKSAEQGWNWTSLAALGPRGG